MHRTQKATGIVALRNHSLPALPVVVISSPGDLSAKFANVVHGAYMSMESWRYRTGLFVRPCPVVPAHGFVESRLLTNVGTMDEVQSAIATVWEEATAADPEAELLVMPYIDSDINLIWRPGVVTIGPGHDGATSGKNSVSIPCPILNNAHLPGRIQRVLEDARITDTPYIEAVRARADTRRFDSDDHMFNETDTRIYLTQLRNGPGGDTRPDYIPATMTVETIVQTDNEDLLAWKARVETFAPGTVVYHPGGNCSDHYFVHCRVNQVPILTTRKPQLGEVLSPTLAEPLDAKAMLRGVATGLTPELENNVQQRTAVQAISHLLHSAGHIEGADAYWLGVAAMLMVRLGYAAALGEYRHSFRSGGLRTQPRHLVYGAVLKNLFEHRQKIEHAWASFHYGKWNGGFGGKPWAQCTEQTAELERQLLALITHPTPAQANHVVSQLNVVVNLAHNNGWWLNKFAQKEDFDNASYGEPVTILRTSSFLYDAHTKSHEERARWIFNLRQLRALTPVNLLRVDPQPPKPTILPDFTMEQCLELFKTSSMVAVPRVRTFTENGEITVLHMQLPPNLTDPKGKVLLGPTELWSLQQLRALARQTMLRFDFMKDPVRYSRLVLERLHGTDATSKLYIPVLVPAPVFDQLISQCTQHVENAPACSLSSQSLCYTLVRAHMHECEVTFHFREDEETIYSAAIDPRLWTQSMDFIYKTMRDHLTGADSEPPVFSADDIASVYTRYGITIGELVDEKHGHGDESDADDDDEDEDEDE